MQNLIGSFVTIIGILGGVLLFNILNVYYLNKYRPNKWILLAISIIGLILIIPLIRIKMIPGVAIGIGLFFCTFFGFWFFDRRGYREKVEKQIVIKPKAKPNRVKSNNK